MDKDSSMKVVSTLVHEIVIQLTGGTAGIRYDADLERVTTYLEAAQVIAYHHPFVDGNKRTAYIMWNLSKIYEQKTIALINFMEFEAIVEKLIEQDREWMQILARI